MWRVSSDLIDSFDGVNDWGGIGVLQVIDIMAPLFAGNDLRSMSPFVHDVLTYKEAISVNQDALGKQSVR